MIAQHLEKHWLFGSFFVGVAVLQLAWGCSSSSVRRAASTSPVPLERCCCGNLARLRTTGPLLGPR